MASEFQNIINTEKIKRVTNLSLYVSSEWNTSDTGNNIYKHFKDKKVDSDSIEEYLKSKWLTKNIADNFPNIKLDKWKEKIISDIENMWPFKNPEDLAKKIGQYIKNNMKYDAIIWLNFIWEKSDLNITKDDIPFLEDTWKKKIYKLPNLNSKKKKFEYLEKFYLNWLDWIWMNEYQINLIKDRIEHIDTKKLNEIEKKYLIQLRQELNKSPTELLVFLENKFKNDIKDQFKSFFNKIIAPIHDEMTNFWYSVQVQDYLEKYKLWVCRHFSVIQKEIYNEISKKHFVESTMIYIRTEQHAYNLLAYEKWNETIYKYLDITRFIWWAELFFKQWINEKRWGEIWAKNKSLDDNLSDNLAFT